MKPKRIGPVGSIAIVGVTAGGGAGGDGIGEGTAEGGTGDGGAVGMDMMDMASTIQVMAVRASSWTSSPI